MAYTGLSLNNGQTYYLSVKAFDQAHNQSATISSDGVVSDQEGPVAGQVTDEDCLTLNSCIKNVKVLAEKNIQNRERRDGCVVARNS